MNTFLLISFAAGITLLTFQKRRPIHGPRMMLIRALFPSWRFFEDAGQFLFLYYRVDSSAWLEVPHSSPRSWTTFIFNPTGNLVSAGHSLVQRLVSDISEMPDEELSTVQECTSYVLVARWIQHQVGLEGSPAGRSFQFKIVLAREGQENEEILVSPEISA